MDVSLKRYGLVYIHQDGKKRYSILDPSEKKVTHNTSQSVDLSQQPSEEGEEKVEHRKITTDKLLPKE